MLRHLSSSCLVSAHILVAIGAAMSSAAAGSPSTQPERQVDAAPMTADELRRENRELRAELERLRAAIVREREDAATARTRAERAEAGLETQARRVDELRDRLDDFIGGVPGAVMPEPNWLRGQIKSRSAAGGVEYATVSLGSAHGVAKGTRFVVFDDKTKTFHGYVVIERVDAEESTGRLKGPSLDQIRPGLPVRSTWPEAELRPATSQPSRHEVIERRRVEHLLKVVEDHEADPDARMRAAEELGQIADPSAVDRLVARLPGEWDGVTLQIVAALGKIGDAKALPKLRDLRRTPMARGQINATVDWAIRRIERRQGVGELTKAESKRVEELLGMVQDRRSDADTRKRAARELGHIGDPSAVDRLVALLPGEWDAVTLQIVGALARIGDARALPKLREMDRTPMVPGIIAADVHGAIRRIERLQDTRSLTRPLRE